MLMVVPTRWEMNRGGSVTSRALALVLYALTSTQRNYQLEIVAQVSMRELQGCYTW